MSDRPFTDWSQVSLFPDLAEVARIYNRSERAIERLVRLRRFVAPLQTRPMRWSRADLESDWSGQKVSAFKGRKAL